MHYRLSVGAARVRLIHALLLLTTLSACANTAAFSESGLNDGALAADVVRGEAETSAANTPRMLIYRADLEILVSDPQRAGDKAKLIVQALGGYIENASQGDGRYARLTLRVPAAKLDRAL